MRMEQYVVEDTSAARRQASEEGVRAFIDARFGLSMHFGLYAILGRGEWVRHTESIAADEYRKLMGRAHRPTPTRRSGEPTQRSAWALSTVTTPADGVVRTNEAVRGTGPRSSWPIRAVREDRPRNGQRSRAVPLARAERRGHPQTSSVLCPTRRSGVVTSVSMYTVRFMPILSLPSLPDCVKKTGRLRTSCLRGSACEVSGETRCRSRAQGSRQTWMRLLPASTMQASPAASSATPQG